MIIKRKLYTRQETKAMKEMYQALKKGNIGRSLSAKKFVKARHVSNETIDALTGKGQVVDYSKNSQAINDIGLPETAKAYKRMMEKYTNPKLHERFKKIQAASSNNRLRVARQNVKKSGKFASDPLTLPLDDRKFYKDLKDNGNFDIHKAIKDASKQNRTDLKELEAIKKERARKNYRINRKAISQQLEKQDLQKLIDQVDYSVMKGTKESDPELSQKIIKDLKKKGIKFTTNSKEVTKYNTTENKINLSNRQDVKDPASVLHENGHRLSLSRRETKPEYYGQREKLDENKNTSDNLRKSIMNKVSDLATLTEETNASYHQAAHGKKYGATKMQIKSIKKSSDNAIRSYETGLANLQLKENEERLMGKFKNK